MLPSEDQVILVDEQDKEIGTMDKVAAHRGEGKLHRAISVFLFCKTTDGIELLLQRRSAEKIVGAGQWANTCCGNVRPGESYEQCALRRLREELGITNVVLQPVMKFRYQVKCNQEFSEHEMDQVFAGWYDGESAPNPAEVSEVVWKTTRQIEDELQRSDEMYAPWFRIMCGHHDALTKSLQTIRC